MTGPAQERDGWFTVSPSGQVETLTAERWAQIERDDQAGQDNRPVQGPTVPNQQEVDERQPPMSRVDRDEPGRAGRTVDSSRTVDSGIAGRAVDDPQREV